MLAQFRTLPLAIQLNHQQFGSIIIIPCTSFAYTSNCLIDLYNTYLRIHIILFTHNVSSHKTDWILSKPLLLVLSYSSYVWVSSLMNAIVWEYLREISINVNKFFVYFVYVHSCRVVVACLFVYSLVLCSTLLLFVYFVYFFYTDVVATLLFYLQSTSSYLKRF